MSSGFIFIRQNFIFSVKTYIIAFYNLGKVKDIRCEVVIVTNMLDDVKEGYLCVVSNLKVDTAILNYNEIGGCLSFIDFMCENILTTDPPHSVNYTEIIYETSDNVKGCAYYSENSLEWRVRIDYPYIFVCDFNNQSLSSLYKMMQRAQTMIAKKVQ